MALTASGSSRSYCAASGLGPVNWSYSFWFQTASATNQYPLCLAPTAAALSEDYAALIGGNQGWTGSYKSPTGNAAITANSTYTGGAWTHLCGFWKNTTDRDVFDFDAAMTQRNDTTSVVTDTPDRLVIGDAYYNGAFSAQGIIGSLAWLGVWSTELSVAEFRSLRTGYSPRKVRPASLFGFWPLVKNSNSNKGQAMTDSGAPGFDGALPRVFH